MSNENLMCSNREKQYIWNVIIEKDAQHFMSNKCMWR